MDEDQYSYSEESVPLSIQSLFWKKKNSVSPASKSQSKTEVWMKTVVIPSGSQVPEDSVGTDPETQPQTTIHSSVPLPGSVIDYSEEIKEHSSCVVKNIMVEDTSKKDGDKNSWVDKLDLNINKWSFLNSLTVWSEKRALEKDHVSTSGICSNDDHKGTEMEEWTTKEVPYIPYKLATLYIMKNIDIQILKWKYHPKLTSAELFTQLKLADFIILLNAVLKARKAKEKIVKDMQQMQNKHLKIIRQLDNIRKENQEQTVTTIEKYYVEKMRTLKSQFEAYREVMNKSNTLWQDTVKSLRKRNRQLVQENKDLLLQMKQETEKWEEEKVANEEEVPELSMEKMYLWQAHTMLQKMQESSKKQERKVTAFLQSKRRYNKSMKPQITALIFLKSLVKKVHTIYCDVPEAQQYISQLIRKNEDERADREEAFNNAQSDILSYEVFDGNEPVEDKRTQLSMKFFRNICKAKSDLEYIETEKIVFDCIQTGKIPKWIKRDCLYVALTEDPTVCLEETDPPSRGTQTEV